MGYTHLFCSLMKFYLAKIMWIFKSLTHKNEKKEREKKQ